MSDPRELAEREVRRPWLVQHLGRNGEGAWENWRTVRTLMNPNGYPTQKEAQRSLGTYKQGRVVQANVASPGGEWSYEEPKDD